MDTLPRHPLQSHEWGVFRKKTGIEVVDVADGFQMTIHPLPKLSYTIGYIPKCDFPDDKILEKLTKIGKEKNCIFIKLEPNILVSTESKLQILNSKYKIQESKHPLFTKYSFHLDLTQSEEDLMKQMKQKTRYNVRIAEKNDVVIKEETSEEAFEKYLALSRETWDRQKFFGHTEKYHRLMWEVLHPAGIAHLLIAYYKDVPLVAWVVFLYKGVLYYPYGASSIRHKEVMASNLMMWAAIKWGKKKGAKLFDMWGSLGSEPDTKDPWYGFHRFKEGYGARLVEFVGSYDLVINPILYSIYSALHPARQVLLKFLR
jgi:lipid II:glycine glycyltransferase (peptidoglycan interpeptide bridge formation enzyme)